MIAAIKEPKLKGKKYEEYALNNPSDREIDKLWNNAAESYLLGKDLSNAIKAFEKIVSSYPKFTNIKNIMFRLPRMYDNMWVKSAILHYQRYAQRFPKDKSTPAFSQRVCTLKLIINADDAEGSCLSFARKYSKVGRYLLSKLLNSYYFSGEKEKYYNLATKHYMKFSNVSINEKITIYKRIYNLFNINSTNGFQAKQKILSLGKSSSVSGEALRYVTEFLLEDINSSEKHDMKLKGGGVQALQISMQELSQALESLEKKYSKVISYQEVYSAINIYYNLASGYDYFLNSYMSLQLLKELLIKMFKHSSRVQLISLRQSQ